MFNFIGFENKITSLMNSLSTNKCTCFKIAYRKIIINDSGHLKNDLRILSSIESKVIRNS
ncbi:hypothetical protein BpHYR1_005381 [Brachionus plicatilis]|uniref:Uncharacterized protein n=1 Tax=Brachionus plicatilis TaxID=10195 RepID=A0A3M7RH08_BRAPC|nr:hypothetical protein BpHYR1_005381 [Brachionus plicatilis]